MRSWLLENPPPLPDYHPWNLHSPDAEVARAPPHSYQRHAGGVPARACRLHPAPPGARAWSSLAGAGTMVEDAGDWRLRAATDGIRAGANTGNNGLGTKCGPMLSHRA